MLHLARMTTSLILLAQPVTAQHLNYGTAAEAIAINSVPVPLSVEEPYRNTVGRLYYRGGLHLYAEDSRFGGLSALDISADGQRLIALSDRGLWFSGCLIYNQAGELTGLRDTYLGSLTGLDGRPLSLKSDGDAESMASGVGGELIVAFERRHRLWRYRPEVLVPEPLPGSAKMAELPFNKGVEALALLANGSLLALSEGRKNNHTVVGWIIDSGHWSELTYRTGDGFRVTGATTHPNGDVLLLERLFTRRGKNAIRLKRVTANAIKGGALLKGKTIAELRPPLTIDNFEGIKARKELKGGVLVYLVSDDNYSSKQRTLLMIFELPE